MDFFAPDSSRMQVSAAPTDVSDPFAEAIGRRFSGAAAPMLTAKLVLDKSPLDNAFYAPTPGSSTRPESVVPSLSMARSGSSQATATFSNMSLDAPGRPPVAKQLSLSLSAQPADVSRYTSVTPKDLATFLVLSPQPLVLDVRSTNAHALSHIRGAISLSVPSTLLKRPNFSLINLSTMVASPSAQAAFSQWPTAARILVYDADLPKLADGCGVLGLLRKFDAAGFKGELAWVVGGHNAVARLARDCLEASSTLTESEDRPSSNGGFVHAHNLPQSAFQQTGSTTGFGHKPNKLQASNPFYDNIRQNRELSHGITERIPLALPQEVLSRKDEIPVPWVRDIVENSEKEKGIEALAMQFYRVELGEQRRLQGVMSHHSQECSVHPNNQNELNSHSNPDTNHDSFPFSIIAGVEKGTKNRYKNIWPYEHARVRLQTATDDGSDYVNASYVRPRGTNLRYIATQGPMPATFTDFWTMVWEQNVHVIVMLTRQVEGNQLKCGDYWSGEEYGPLRLQLIATEGGKEEVAQATGFDFGFDTKKPDEDDQVTIRRTFALSHTEYPDEPPRKVVQFQFLPWLDMNVPETPTGLLALVKSVREAAEEADKHKEQKRPSPVLVHCSAGVGRTGSFVAIDAILDGIRKDLEAKRPTLVETPSSGSTSESDPETSGEPSSDSLPSAKIRRGSLPESDMAAYRRPVNGAGLHMTPARQRQISLRKTLGARRSASNVPATRLSEPENGRRVTHLDAGRKHLAGAAAGPTSAETTNAASALHSSDSSVSFNFSASSLPVSTLSSQNQGMSKPPPLALSRQATEDWSSNVAKNVSKSDLVAPQPVPASASKIGTPRPDSEMRDRDRDTFDYVLPRSLNRDKSASPLASMDEPIREVLEDMREQRMSLCQSLRQYVFVHRAVVEGVLAMVDEEKQRARGEQVGLGAKRHASPTELIKVDMAGDAARVKKRTSALGNDAMVVDS